MIACHLKAAALAILLGGIGSANAAAAQPLKAAFEQCLAAPSSAFLGFRRDGEPIIAEESGPGPRQRYVTHGQTRFAVPPISKSPILRPAGARPGVLLLADEAGNERYGLYYQSIAAKTPPVLLSPPGARVAAPLALPSSATTVFTSTAGSGPIWGVLESQPAAPLKVLFQQNGAWQTLAASADAKRLLMQETFGLYDRVLYVFDRPTGVKVPVFLGPRPLAVRGAALSPDSAFVYAVVATAEQGGVLIRSDVSTGELQILLQTDWPLYSLTLSSDGARLVALENRNGRTVLHPISVAASGSPNPIALKGWASFATLNDDGTRLGMTLESPGTPAQALILPLGSAAEHAAPRPPCAAAMMTAVTIDRPSPVGQQGILPGFLIEPTRTANGPRPLLIAFHGGPEGQWRMTGQRHFFALADALDMAVLLPNVVGSTGYGLLYAAADDAAQRIDVIDDIVLLLDWIAADPRFDTNKVAVSGASYGGYLALLAQSQFNDRLAGAISDVGITDLPSFLRETPITRRALRRAEYGDERINKINKALNALSPLTHVQNISKPIFLAHGVNDARVPVNQSTKMADALAAQGTPVTYTQIPGEGHVIRDVEKQRALAQDKAAFLKAVFGAQ